MRIAHGIEMLEISSEVMGSPRTIYPTLLWDDDNTVLVDAGFPGQLALLREAVGAAGCSFEHLNHVILTHHDLDHVGSLASILNELPGRVKVTAHEIEKAYINGEKTPLKVAKMEADVDNMPEEQRAFLETYRAAFHASQVEVDQTCTDGDVLPIAGGITVIHTPGHTLGHICLYLPQSKVLIAGDLLTVQEGRLSTTPLAMNYDLDMLKKSLLKMRDFDVEQIICYHGGLYQKNANLSIAAMAEGEPFS